MKLIRWCLVLFMFGVTVYTYPLLPETMPTHWNIRGEIDGRMPKAMAAWLMPVMALIMFGLFSWLPKLDPKKEKYRLFTHEWEIIQTGILGFFAYLHTVIIYVTLHPEQTLMPLMFVGLGALFIIIGNYLSKVRQNYFIGIKVPWTLNDEENWNKTHRFASWWFVGAGIATVIEAFTAWNAPTIIFGGIMLASFMPMLYSFLLFKKKPELMKWAYVALGGLGLIFWLWQG